MEKEDLEQVDGLWLKKMADMEIKLRILEVHHDR